METDEVQLHTASPSPALRTPTVAERTPSDTGPALPSPGWSPDRRRVRRAGRAPHRRTAYVTGAVLLVVAVIVSVVNYDRLQRTNISVAEAKQQLHRTTGRVAAARAQLAQAEREAGAAAGALAVASDQLGAVQAQLAATQSNIRSAGVNIANLNACLSGVNQALNEISLGDQAGAAAILRQYGGQCQAAQPSG